MIGWSFFNSRQPNRGHIYLAKIEKLGFISQIITQVGGSPFPSLLIVLCGVNEWSAVGVMRVDKNLIRCI